MSAEKPSSDQPSTGEAAIEVRDLTKSFDRPVLQGINLRVKQGEILSVLGRSGTGKSVLLKLLIGLEQPDSGTIWLHGQLINGADEDVVNRVRKLTGFLFQQAALYDSMTIIENVSFPLARHSDKPPAEQKQHAQELLKQVGMESDGDKMPDEISGGMRKRVGLARALALDPEILMLDEPTAGLDPITAREIVDLIGNIKKERNAACVLVTHDLQSARRISDRFVMLNEGKILADGPLSELEASKDPFVSQFFQDAGCSS